MRHRLLFIALLGAFTATLLGPAPGALGAESQLVFSTYLGGAFKYGDIGNAIAVDGSGNVYVTGRSYYSDFPVTPGAFQTDHRNLGPWDTTAFVAKLDPTGSRLIYATYLGGEGGEVSGEGIAVDSAGDAYVSGYTNSKNFPTTPGALRGSGSGGFVAKLNPAGSGLVYSTLIGDDTTHAAAIAVDPSGSAYLAAGSVWKLDSTGTGLAYSKSLDGGAFATDIAVDPAGDAYVAGVGKGASAAKLDPSGGVAYSTALGGGKSGAEAIAVDSEGHAYVAGHEGTGIFVIKLAADGTAPIYSTHLGSASHRSKCRCATTAAGIAVDAAGDAFLTGTTRWPHFPTTTGALQRNRQASRLYPSTPFVSELSPTGSGPAYSTFLGGGSDFASGVAVNPAGTAYVTGGTISGGIPTSPSAFQRKSHSNEGYAAFVTALDPAGPPLAGLSGGKLERRGNRLRLHGALDPLADGTLVASARHGHTRRALSVRRSKGRFVATSGALSPTKSWTVTVSFRGRQPWDSENLRRKDRGESRPRGRRSQANR